MKIDLIVVPVLVISMAILGCSTMSSAKPGEARYGIWETYSSTDSLVYPDFKLRFLGLSEQPLPDFVAMGPVYRFLVFQGDLETTVSWSSGTGDIGPELFEISGKKFFLEMKSSYHLREKAASEQQIVVWPESEFLRRNKGWSLW
jgi:hypothetical protein